MHVYYMHLLASAHTAHVVVLHGLPIQITFQSNRNIHIKKTCALCTKYEQELSV